MSDQNVTDTITFDLPKNQSSVIKVIGVGGGGSNAVNHMFGQGIRGVDFVVCNTDAQALTNSPVPNKIQLGVTLTEGLGAGANPEVGEKAALENVEEIKNTLGPTTKMVFITAGMGGGTGTGAAPIIAKTAKDMGILTVGICTIPFSFEGLNRRQQAEKGVESLRTNVDSLIVINNNKLREVYGNLGFKAGFAKADEVLATAARGIAEVITHHYTTNIDLRDAKTVLADSGTAIMGSASAGGEDRAGVAIKKALDSPLLNDNHIRGAKNVLLLIVSGTEEITIDEIGEINDHIQNEAGGSANIIMGIGEDESHGADIFVTIVATGFNAEQQVQVIGRQPQKVVHTLEDEQAVSTSVYQKPVQLEEDDDNLIETELQKADAMDEVEADSPQPNLFELESEEEEIILEENLEIDMEEETPEETEIVQEEVPEAEKEETITFELGDVEDEAEDIVVSEPTPEVEAEAEVKMELTENDEEEVAEPSETFFQIGTEETAETSTPEAETEHETEALAEQPPVLPQGNADTSETVKYSLEDYVELEKKLNEAAPQKKEEPAPAAKSEDEDLKFEVKKVPEKEEPKAAQNQRVSPMDSTIAESMHLKAHERREQLKAFNYRFKNNPMSVNEVENEPAYKRQGLNIDEHKYSADDNISRFTIDDSEGKGDIKTNNSFLHDNVD